jgi:hypothetical protein
MIRNTHVGCAIDGEDDVRRAVGRLELVKGNEAED